MEEKAKITGPESFHKEVEKRMASGKNVDRFSWADSVISVFENGNAFKVSIDGIEDSKLFNSQSEATKYAKSKAEIK